ncbi:MAG TPA: hypothetical protein DCE78_09630, partial [Bacteroidetes bacterium]|nr:hypothetical protein [Bacteroidota bacterium]
HHHGEFKAVTVKRLRFDYCIVHRLIPYNVSTYISIRPSEGVKKENRKPNTSAVSTKSLGADRGNAS